MTISASVRNAIIWTFLLGASAVEAAVLTILALTPQKEKTHADLRVGTGGNFSMKVSDRALVFLEIGNGNGTVMTKHE